jgi:hypothetical protein
VICAAIRIILRAGDNACVDGIMIYIAHEYPPVDIRRHPAGFESAAKERAVTTTSSVEPEGILTLDAHHCPGKFPAQATNKQMIMGGHDGIDVDFELIPSNGMGNPR